MRINKIMCPLIGILLLFFGCSTQNQLDRTIRKELASGVHHDTVFLGLKFGISMQEFYNHCRDLNQQGLVKEGSRNMSVEYIFKDSLDQPIAFNFYAHQNKDGQVHQYNTSFNYYAWALNRHLQSDRLMEMLTPILMDWYGGNEPFTMVKDSKEHLYKIDGNRMIDLYIYDESTIVATYVDLSYQENMEVSQ